jgi:hypothetical protein
MMGNFSSPPRSDRRWGPRSFLCNGYRGVKWSEHEANQLHASSAEVMNAWRNTSTPLILLHGVVLNEERITSS